MSPDTIDDGPAATGRPRHRAHAVIAAVALVLGLAAPAGPVRAQSAPAPGAERGLGPGHHGPHGPHAMPGMAGGQGMAGARFELVTPAEARAGRHDEPGGAPPADSGIRTRSLPGAPRTVPAIVVLAPSATAAISAPIRIQLAFQPVPGARIVPSSFRVLYGVLKIDLTERLRRHAQITEQGVLVEQAHVPDGLHRLFMQVSDDKGNQAEQELRLRVGAGS